MNIEVPAGRYVLAVSGGVDSMVLLDILRQQSGVELIVAHFNHGIRVDAQQDEKLVVEVAKKHDLKYEIGYGRLGAKASEDQARRARYHFLRAVKDRYQTKAIITAHHQDDLIETALLNLLRGTGRRGLVSLKDRPGLKRPLLRVSKQQILDYARQHRINWCEDPTNQDVKFLRNYIRLRLVPKLTEVERAGLLNNIDKVAKIDNSTTNIIATISHNIKKNRKIDRRRFNQLPSKVAEELLTYWLRQQRVPDIDQKTIQRLHLALKTAAAGTSHPVKKNLTLKVGRHRASFATSV